MSRPAPSALPVPLRAPLKPKRQLITSSLGARGNADRETVPSWQGLWAWGGGVVSGGRCQLQAGAERASGGRWEPGVGWGVLSTQPPRNPAFPRTHGGGDMPFCQSSNEQTFTCRLASPRPPGRQRPDVSSFLSLRGGAGQGEGESGVAGPGQQQPRRAAGDARAALGAAANAAGAGTGDAAVFPGLRRLPRAGRVGLPAAGTGACPDAGVRGFLRPHPWRPPLPRSLLLLWVGEALLSPELHSHWGPVPSGTDMTLQLQGMRFLRIRWQGGLGKAGSQLWALCSSPRLPAFPPAASC